MNPVSGGSLNQVSLVVTTFENVITVDYTCLPGNQPCTYGNWLGIWEGSQVSWNVRPVNYVEINNDSPIDSLPVYQRRAPNMSYVIGYGTGGKREHSGGRGDEAQEGVEKSRPDHRPHVHFQTVCATIQVDASGAGSDLQATSVAVLSFSNNTLLINYQTPVGNVPRDNHNWIGIWPGSSVSYDGSNVLRRDEVKSVYNQGEIVVENFPITVGTTYTVAYGTGKAWSDIAATFTFNTPAYGS